MRGIILSAGLGERLRPLTLKRAKPALEFLNMPMMAFPYYWLNTLSLTDLVFNTHYLPETIRHAAMQTVDPSIRVHFPHEEAILGSGGGIWNARFHLQGEKNFAVANGDGVVLCEDEDVLVKMRKLHESEKALATILVCPLEGVGTRIPGVWMSVDGRVKNFGKSPKGDGLACFHYASYMLFSERIWKYLPEGSSNILYDVLESRIAEGDKVLGYKVTNMRWFETGNADDYLRATMECLTHLKTRDGIGRNLWNILQAQAPGSEFTSTSDHELSLVDRTAELALHTNLHGFQVIGRGCQIEDHVTLENCVVMPETKVVSGATYKNEVLI